MENQLATQNNGEMTLGDAMALSREDTTETSAEITLEEAMGLPATTNNNLIMKPIPAEHKPGFLKGMALNLYGGALEGAAAFNKAIGWLTYMDQIPGYTEIAVAPAKPEAEKIATLTQSDNFGVTLANDFSRSLGNLGVTLPLDIMTGEITKLSLVGKILPKVEKFLSAIPDFAVGGGVRGLVQGSQTAVEEGKGPIQAAGEGILQGGENMAVGTLYGLAGTGFKGIAKMSLLGTGSVYYEALKENRLPTKEEVAIGFSEGLAYGTVFSIMPALAKASSVKKERTAINEYVDLLKTHEANGDYEAMKATVDKALIDERIRPEVKEALSATLPEPPAEAPKEGGGEDIYESAKKYIKSQRREAIASAKETLGDDATPEEIKSVTDQILEDGGVLNKNYKPAVEIAIKIKKQLGLKGDIFFAPEGQYAAAMANRDGVTYAGIDLKKGDIVINPEYKPHDIEETIIHEFAHNTLIDRGIVDKEHGKEFLKEEQRLYKLLSKLSPKGEVGTGETKIRGLAKGVEEKAIENKLTESFSDLPEYQTVNMKDQASKAQILINKDYEQAKRIARGEELPPTDILPESVFVAVENKATKDGDVALLKDLATSSALTAEATVMGQRIRTLAERNPDSPVTAIKEVSKARDEMAQKRLKGKDIKKLVSEEMAKAKKEIKKLTPTRETWADFILSIQC